MSRNRDRERDRNRKPRTSDLDDARNELFSLIHRCGVLRASDEQQLEWMKDTIEFLGERYTALKAEELKELETVGLRFCRPVINSPSSASADADADAATAAA